MNESKIRELVKNPVYNIQIQVAEGIPAVNGKMVRLSTCLT